MIPSLAGDHDVVALDLPGFGLSDLARVKAPTLVIWGGDDRWIPLADADRFTAAVAGARKVVLEQCGHVPQEEKPEVVLQLLREFLAP